MIPPGSHAAVAAAAVLSRERESDRHRLRVTNQCDCQLTAVVARRREVCAIGAASSISYIERYLEFPHAEVYKSKVLPGV